MNYTKANKKTSNTAVVLGIAAAVAVVAGAWFAGAHMGKRAYAEIATKDVPAVAIDTKDADKEDKGNPFAGRYVTYEGITGIETNGATFLANPTDNDDDIFIEFVVSENGDVLYSSELVPSGQGIDVDFSEFLSGGEHEVVITMNPYLLCDGEYLRCPVNNAQSVKVAI